MATINAIGSNKPIQVSFGGTGDASLTAHGVLVGEGTGAVTALTPGTNGQLLCGSSAADPAFTTLTSSAGTILYTTGAASLNLEASYTQTGRTAFIASNSGAASNVTGDGTLYYPIFDTVVLNQGSNYNAGTGVFTAPVTGLYNFSATIGISNLSVAFLSGVTLFAGTGSGGAAFDANYGVMRDAGNNLIVNISGMFYMLATQTTTVAFAVGASTKTVGFLPGSFFAGYLVC